MFPSMTQRKNVDSLKQGGTTKADARFSSLMDEGAFFYGLRKGTYPFLKSFVKDIRRSYKNS
jgi:hypothetical protein